MTIINRIVNIELDYLNKKISFDFKIQTMTPKPNQQEYMKCSMVSCAIDYVNNILMVLYTFISPWMSNLIYD